MSEHGLAGGLVPGGNQAARFGLILGLQALAMPGATLRGIEHPGSDAGEGGTCLAFAGFQLRRNSANPGRRTVMSSRRDDGS